MEPHVLRLARLLFGDSVTMVTGTNEHGRYAAIMNDDTGVVSAYGVTHDEACDRVVRELTQQAMRRMKEIANEVDGAQGTRW